MDKHCTMVENVNFVKEQCFRVLASDILKCAEIDNTNNIYIFHVPTKAKYPKNIRYF